MIRFALRTLKQFVLAVLVFIGAVCTLEVGLRARRLYSASQCAGGPQVAVPESWVQPSRSTFWEPTPQLRAIAEPGEGALPHLVRINSLGLRGPEPRTPRPDDVFRILCLGDEDAFAAWLPEEDAWPRQLGRLLAQRTATDVEVLNGGCPGGSPLIAALLFRHRWMGLQPDVVLVDIPPWAEERHADLTRFVLLDPRGRPVAAMHPGLQGRCGPTSLLDDEFLLLRSIRNELLDVWIRGQGAGGGFSGGTPSIVQAVEAVRELSDAEGGVTLACTISRNARPLSRDAAADDGDSADWPPRVLASGLKEAGIDLVDASPEFGDLALEGHELFDEDGRLTAEGSAAYAEVLARAILEQFGPGAESGPSGSQAVRDGEAPPR